MNYFIYQVPGQLKSETLETTESFEAIANSFRQGEYGLRQVNRKEYAEECVYNNSDRNPWN